MNDEYKQILYSFIFIMKNSLKFYQLMNSHNEKLISRSTFLFKNVFNEGRQLFQELNKSKGLVKMLKTRIKEIYIVIEILKYKLQLHQSFNNYNK